MASLNKVLLIGNLTREPEQRSVGASSVCSFGLAMNRRYTTARGEQREETCFVDVDVWGRSAEVVMQYVHKGDPLFVEGRLNYDQWDDRETGKKRSRLTVRADNVQLMGGARGNGDDSQMGVAPRMGGNFGQPQGGYGSQYAPAPMPSFDQPKPGMAGGAPIGDDDLPF